MPYDSIVENRQPCHTHIISPLGQCPPNSKQRLHTPPLLQLLFNISNKLFSLHVYDILGVG